MPNTVDIVDPFGNPTKAVEVFMINIVPCKAQLSLEDGSVVEMQSMPLVVYRCVDKWNVDGTPLYMINNQVVSRVTHYVPELGRPSP